MVTNIIEKNSYLEFINLKSIFTGVCYTLSHHTNDIRQSGMVLMRILFERVEDDIDTILKSLRNLGKVIKKEVKNSLNNTQKLELSSNFRIFAKANVNKYSNEYEND